MTARTTILAFTALILLAPSVAAQNGVLDQSNLASAPVSFDLGAGAAPREQQFVATIDGQLEGIVLEVSSPVANDGVALWVFSGAGPHPQGLSSSQLLATRAVDVSGVARHSVFVDLTAAGIAVQAGDLMTFQLRPVGAAVTVYGSETSPPAYTEPSWLQANSWTSAGNQRLGFETYVLLGGVSPILDILSPCSPNSIPGATVVHATPGEVVALGYSFGVGTSVIAQGACAGVVIDLLQPRGLRFEVVNATGFAFFSLGTQPPAAVCGNLTVQAIDLSSCLTSNTLPF